MDLWFVLLMVGRTRFDKESLYTAAREPPSHSPCLLARSLGRLLCMNKRIITCMGMRFVEAQCCGTCVPGFLADSQIAV